MVTCTGHIGIHEGEDGRTYVYVRTLMTSWLLNQISSTRWVTIFSYLWCSTRACQRRARSSAMILTVMDAILAIAWRSLKNSGLQQGLNPRPCDTGATLCFSPFLVFPTIVFLVRKEASLVFCLPLSPYLVDTPVLFFASVSLVLFSFRIKVCSCCMQKRICNPESPKDLVSVMFL